MATERTPAAIAIRFEEEREYIARYVRFLKAKTTIHDRQVQDLNRILRRVGIESLPTRRYDRTSEPYSPEEIATLVAPLDEKGREAYRSLASTHFPGLTNATPMSPQIRYQFVNTMPGNAAPRLSYVYSTEGGT